METIDHVFWTCTISALAWKQLLEWFGAEAAGTCADINSFFVFAMEAKFSVQFKKLWRFAVVTLIWTIWKERNACTFEDKRANVKRILCFVKAAIIEASKGFNLGHCLNDWGDFQRGRRLGVTCAFAPPTEMVSVTWWPPLIGWIKVNTDGSATSSPGQIGAGGVFRDAAGYVRGCFHTDGGRGFAFEAELLAVITAIEIAHEKQWHKLWLETDSTYVAQLLEMKSERVPWRFANSWRSVLSYIEVMDFRVSHIFREGNQVADIMANASTPVGWWPYSIPIIVDAVARDMCSPRYHRRV